MSNKKFLFEVERFLWWVRYLILFPVVFLVIALVYLIILMGERLRDATGNLLYKNNPFEVLTYLIDIVDFTLIAVIILLILWWVYELFIRPMTIDVASQVNADRILIHDIDELKQKLWKVIIISWVVHIFKQVLVFHVERGIDLIYAWSTILLLALALFLIEKVWTSSIDESCEEH